MSEAQLFTFIIFKSQVSGAHGIGYTYIALIIGSEYWKRALFERVCSSQLSCLGAHPATDQHALIASLRLQLSQNTLFCTSFNKLCQYRAHPKKLLWRHPFDEWGGGASGLRNWTYQQRRTEDLFIPWLLSVQASLQRGACRWPTRNQSQNCLFH